ncbi:RNA methyltransferase [Methanocella arvoryzae]|uniref:rRNA methyltransferase (SpoU family) n=1 Tax=Methanocella arvoryzae (strain DSM 22066 / NBRC 105507 / MRE50) TaxID=351160 RepID=Q0W2E0_METAR|nr:RNA methyltransferase [Methanocella arvoryzae]CAJ37453.1 rRNA methyltransferase (SpoU family) [Methanocella arvoryzae MRE50]
MSVETSMHVRVVLVEPAFEGNVGSVCRAMKNFGFDDLVLVRPCELGNSAKAMASHAQDLLASAAIVDTVEEALDGVSVIVGTTGKPGSSTREHIRMPCFSPRELKTLLEDKQGTVALLFGKENHGLPNEILEKCGVVLSIPTSDDYPVMNLSHAVAVVLYELADIKGNDFLLADSEMQEILYQHVEQLLDSINYADYKKDKTSLMIRRIIGRAMISPREYFTLMGLIRDIQLALARAEAGQDTSWVENN